MNAIALYYYLYVLVNMFLELICCFESPITTVTVKCVVFRLISLVYLPPFIVLSSDL